MKKRLMTTKNIILIALAGALLIIFFMSPSDTKTIPDEVYDKLTPDSPYYSTLKEIPKKIVWFGSFSHENHKLKAEIDTFLQKNNLSQFYEHKPTLKSSKATGCTDKNCPEVYLATNCTENFCIIFPLSHRIIIVKQKDLYPTLLKVKDWQDYFY